jgi:hypothetical protein
MVGSTEGFYVVRAKLLLERRDPGVAVQFRLRIFGCLAGLGIAPADDTSDEPKCERVGQALIFPNHESVPFVFLYIAPYLEYIVMD